MHDLGHPYTTKILVVYLQITLNWCPFFSSAAPSPFSLPSISYHSATPNGPTSHPWIWSRMHLLQLEPPSALTSLPPVFATCHSRWFCGFSSYFSVIRAIYVHYRKITGSRQATRRK